MKTQRHSEAVLTDQRDQWWNGDFLVLLADRFGLRNCHGVLDVGCGHGHWGLRILPLLHPSARLEAVDQEPDWIEKAQERAKAFGLGARCRCRVSRAEQLPFSDSAFDLVTCQTLLMHVASPPSVLAEMVRVLRPGGRLLLSEPSNLPSEFMTDTVNRALSPQQMGDLAELFFACSRGRVALERGDDSVGDVLPGLLLQ